MFAWAIPEGGGWGAQSRILNTNPSIQGVTMGKVLGVASTAQPPS